MVVLISPGISADTAGLNEAYEFAALLIQRQVAQQRGRAGGDIHHVQVGLAIHDLKAYRLIDAPFDQPVGGDDIAFVQLAETQGLDFFRGRQIMAAAVSTRNATSSERTRERGSLPARTAAIWALLLRRAFWMILPTSFFAFMAESPRLTGLCQRSPPFMNGF